MGKHESVEGIEDQVQTLVPPSEAPPMAPSMIDRGPALEPTRMALAAIEALKIEPPTGEAPRIALSGIASMPRFTAPPSGEIRLDAMPAEAAEAAADAMPPEAESAHEAAEQSPRRVSAFTMMAASLAAAAAVGAMIGAVVASGIARPTPVASAPGIGIEDVNALKEQVVQARVELAALKSNIDAGHRSANQQFTRIAERVERMERTQAEPVAKLSKAVDSLEKVRRAELALHADATGTITPPQPVGAPPAKLGNVEGWVLRDVHRGTAFIEGRMGIIEVDQGDMVPGLGRVEAIRKQDGKWVVVTSKGLIVPPPK